MSFQNWHKEFNEFWLKHLKVSKMYTLMGCFWPKYINFELRTYRGVMFGGTEEWYKIWRKTDLCFQKWHEEFDKFSPPHHWKVSKLGLWWDPFVQSRKFMSLKFTVELYQDNEEWCKIWRRIWLVSSKFDMRNLTNFGPNTRKSQKFALQWVAFDQSI